MTLTAVPVRHVEHCMGTVFSFDVRAPGVDAGAVADAVHWLHQVDATFSTYRENSEIRRLGRGDLAVQDCAPEVREVLARCDALREETDGFFDCRAGGELEPSGYVKGWAIERVSDLLRAAGSRNHSVNGGGDVQCIGSPAPDRGWGIGIADPFAAGNIIATTTGPVGGAEFAVATSGSAERGAHVLDPHTGRPASSLVAVTLVGQHLADLDAYATAAFAMGEQASSWLAGRGLRALIVHSDGRKEFSLGANPALMPDTD